MNSETVERFRQAAGGTWAISWQAIAVSIPFGFIYSLTLLLQPGQSRSTQTAAVALSVASCVVVISWTFFMDRILFSTRSENAMSILQIMFGGVSTGIIYWFTQTLSLNLLGIQDPIGVWIRLVFTIVIVSWWGASASLLLDARDGFNIERRKVIEHAVQVQIAADQGSDLVHKIRNSLAREIAAEITSAQVDLYSQLEILESDLTKSNWRDVSDSLRNVASDVVRPLSMRLWERAEESYPPLRLKKVLRNIVHYQFFRPIPITLIYISTTGLAQFANLTPEFAQRLLFFEVLFIVCVMYGANSLMRKWPNLHSSFFVSTVNIFQMFNFATAVIRATEVGSQVTGIEVLTDTIASISLIFMTSGFGSYRFTRESMINTFRADLDLQEISLRANNRHVSELAISASKILHGQIQTRLLSCAAAIDQAAILGDIQSLNSALQEARLVLDSEVFSKEMDFAHSVSEELALKCKLWNGLCDTEVRAPASLLSLTGEISLDLGVIVEEAIANAVRHGKASSVLIELHNDKQGFVTLVVTDNGIGPTGGTPNVGFNIYSLVTSGNFNFSEAEHGQGSRFEALVPIRI